MGAKKEDQEIDDIINEHATAGRTSINYTAFKSIVLGEQIQEESDEDLSSEDDIAPISKI